MRKFGNRQVSQCRALGKQKWTIPNQLWALLLFSILVLMANIAHASEDVKPLSENFAQLEFAVLGSSNSTSWHSLLKGPSVNLFGLGGDAISVQDDSGWGSSSEDDSEDAESSDGPSNLGRKIKTGFLSALMPGAGQYYNGHKKKAYFMAGAEVGIWVVYFIFDKQGDNRMESARDYAGLFAGTSGSHEEAYWQSIGRYMDSDGYYEAQAREARALGEPTPDLVSESDAWQWDNSDRKSNYQLLRADGNTAYDHRDFMILFSVINRAFSVIDGVMGVRSHPGGIEADILGMNVSLDMIPTWDDPGAKWAISRSF